MKYLFWIIFFIESVLMLWWVSEEMKLKYIGMNPVVYLGFLILIIAILLKVVLKYDKAALILVGIPAIPLAFMGLFLLAVFIIQLVSGPIRWN